MRKDIGAAVPWPWQENIAVDTLATAVGAVWKNVAIDLVGTLELS